MPLIDTRYGRIEVPDSEGDLIGSFLARYGEWAWDEVEFVASNLSPGARVLDVGAYLGTFGLGLGMCAQLADVCFVEANPNVAPYLKENVRRLKRQPCQVVSALASASSNRLMSGRIDPSNWGSLSFATEAAGQAFSHTPHQSVTLPELREFYGPFDLIKLDVEGMEQELIASDVDFFRSTPCKLWVECNESALSLGLIDRLLDIGLDVFYFAFPSHNPDNFNQVQEAALPLAFEAGLLAGRHLNPTMSPRLRAHGCILRSITSREALRTALWETPRWGLREWDGKQATEMAALAGRMFAGQEYGSFLEQKGQSDPSKPGSDAILNHLRSIEAELAAYKAALHSEFPGDNERTIRDLAEREGRLRAELTKTIETQQRAEDALRTSQELISEQNVTKRSLEAQLSQVRTTAGDYLYQLMALAPRVHAAETSAADAHARLHSSLETFSGERDQWRSTELTFHKQLSELNRQSIEADTQLLEFRQQLSDTHQQLLDTTQRLADAIEHATEARQRLNDADGVIARMEQKRARSGLKRYALYQKIWRPLLRKIRGAGSSHRRRHFGK